MESNHEQFVLATDYLAEILEEMQPVDLSLVVSQWELVLRFGEPFLTLEQKAELCCGMNKWLLRHHHEVNGEYHPTQEDYTLANFVSDLSYQEK